MLIVSPLDVAPLRVTVCFLEAIQRCERGFLRKFFEEGFVIFRREILSVETQLSMKSQVCGGDFSSQVIGRSILTTNDNKDGVYVKHNTEERQDITCKPLIGKKLRRGGEASL